MRNFYSSLLLIAVSLWMTGCREAENSLAVPPRLAVADHSVQFPFYKNIEIRPGLSFEAVAWGKGPDTVGGYAVYLTDTIHNNYKALSGERKGRLTGFWNLDLDTDGDPEIYLQFTRNKDQADLIVYEFSDNDFRKISFPSLSDKTKKVYLGKDKFQVRNGELFRTIPVRNEADSTTTELKIQYLLNGNTFSIKDAP